MLGLSVFTDDIKLIPSSAAGLIENPSAAGIPFRQMIGRTTRISRSGRVIRQLDRLSAGDVHYPNLTLADEGQLLAVRRPTHFRLRTLRRSHRDSRAFVHRQQDDLSLLNHCEVLSVR